MASRKNDNDRQRTGKTSVTYRVPSPTQLIEFWGNQHGPGKVNKRLMLNTSASYLVIEMIIHGTI